MLWLRIFSSIIRIRYRLLSVLAHIMCLLDIAYAGHHIQTVLFEFKVGRF